ncbi:MAG: class I SAM-dependent methyltransferase [Candidatus Gottesmanbacteria bacterium]|nr:class I SAM-dependent methyltransferase [Candidatus Gottesmanbacteria bacterium]
MAFLARYINKQYRTLALYLVDCRSLLDFGCGDLSLAKAIHLTHPEIAVTGVDVVDSGVRVSGIDFRIYDGKTLPFRNRQFDVAISYHVFHHTTDPRAAFGELSRVTKKKLLMVEPVFRNRLDRFFMNIVDKVGNGWRNTAIPMPYTFQSEATWRRFSREFHWTVVQTASVGVFPRWLPIGETKLFVLERS